MRAALLVLALVGCKKKATAEVQDVQPLQDVAPVEVALQIAAVSPNLLGAGRAASVMVAGAGFQSGALVRFGDKPATNITFRNQNQLEVVVPALEAGTYDVAVINPDARESVLRAGVTVRGAEVSIDRQRCGFVVLHFDTDQSGLNPQARATLDAVLDCYTNSAGPITVTGHADERGTTDYNLALGQRRARTVQDILATAGVPISRTSIESFGEERPAASGFGEAVWARNRRVEITLLQ